MEKYNYVNSYKTWFMRQAGRYLPEYMEIRNKHQNFLEFCYNTEDIVTVTKQPVDRFKLDFAILFSDILIILDALGAKVTFTKNEGPSVSNGEAILENEINFSKLEKIYLAIKKLTKELKVPLIGFIGGPFTVSCYLTAGEKKNDFETTKGLIYENTETFEKLIMRITEASIIHLENQIKSGCKIVKIFDSWAGILPYSLYKKYVIEPNLTIINAIKSKNKEVEIICFPRGSGEKYIEFSKIVKPDILAIDQFTNLEHINKNVSPDICLQGNLDPLLLSYPNTRLKTETQNILNITKDRKFIFNVGHGLVPTTKIENVYELLKFIQIARQ